MANVRLGNTWIIDTASDQITTEKNQKIAYIVFTGVNVADNLILKESSSSANKISVKTPLASQTVFLPFEEVPLVFGNGIYIDTLTAGATATLVMKPGGN